MQELQHPPKVLPAARFQQELEALPEPQQSSQLRPPKQRSEADDLAQSVLSRSHVLIINRPALQVDGPDAVNPVLHAGWHVDPLGSIGLHVPINPLRGEAVILQPFGMQVPELSIPSTHKVGSERVNPLSLQIGTHRSPDRSNVVQLPLDPCCGGLLASQDR